jgi:hypothetical protein
MPRIHFGHCIGCDLPIRPPYLSFEVHWNTGDGILNWEEIDVCRDCAVKLTADDLHGLVNADEEDAA